MNENAQPEANTYPSGDIPIPNLDLDSSMVSSSEMEQKRHGFNLFKELMEAASEVEKVALLADIMTVVVGLEAYATLGESEAIILSRLLKATGHENEFTFLARGRDPKRRRSIHVFTGEEFCPQQPVVINHVATKAIFDEYKEKLGGFQLPEKFDNATMVALGKQMFSVGGEDGIRMQGLLSGFPFEDAKNFAQMHTAEMPVHPIELLDLENLSKTGISSREILHYFNVLAAMTPESFASALYGNGERVGVNSFGLSWVSSHPIPESTIRQLYKFQQIDQELGISEYMLDELQKIPSLIN